MTGQGFFFFERTQTEFKGRAEEPPDLGCNPCWGSRRGTPQLLKGTQSDWEPGGSETEDGF